MSLFETDYQGGSFFEVFSAQGSNPLEKWKVSPQGVRKVYEKSVKSYVFSCDGGFTGTKMQMPKENLMCLLQPYLIMQLCVPHGVSFHMEVWVVDTEGSKRRLLFSTSFKEPHSTPLHAKIPLHILQRGVWLNLCLDMHEIVGSMFKGFNFRAVELISLSPTCKLRRVFTMRKCPPDTTDDGGATEEEVKAGNYDTIPRSQDFPAGVQAMTQLFRMSKMKRSGEEIGGKEHANHVNGDHGAVGEHKGQAAGHGHEVADAGPTPKEGKVLSSTRKDYSGPMTLAFGSRHPLPPPSAGGAKRTASAASRPRHGNENDSEVPTSRAAARTPKTAGGRPNAGRGGSLIPSPSRRQRRSRPVTSQSEALSELQPAGKLSPLKNAPHQRLHGAPSSKKLPSAASSASSAGKEENGHSSHHTHHSYNSTSTVQSGGQDEADEPRVTVSRNNIPAGSVGSRMRYSTDATANGIGSLASSSGTGVAGSTGNGHTAASVEIRAKIEERRQALNNMESSYEQEFGAIRDSDLFATLERSNGMASTPKPASAAPPTPSNILSSTPGSGRRRVLRSNGGVGDSVVSSNAESERSDLPGPRRMRNPSISSTPTRSKGQGRPRGHDALTELGGSVADESLTLNSGVAADGHSKRVEHTPRALNFDDVPAPNVSNSSNKASFALSGGLSEGTARSSAQVTPRGLHRRGRSSDRPMGRDRSGSRSQSKERVAGSTTPRSNPWGASGATRPHWQGGSSLSTSRREVPVERSHNNSLLTSSLDCDDGESVVLECASDVGGRGSSLAQAPALEASASSGVGLATPHRSTKDSAGMRDSENALLSAALDQYGAEERFTHSMVAREPSAGAAGRDPPSPVAEVVSEAGSLRHIGENQDDGDTTVPLNGRTSVDSFAPSHQMLPSASPPPATGENSVPATPLDKFRADRTASVFTPPCVPPMPLAAHGRPFTPPVFIKNQAVESPAKTALRTSQRKDRPPTDPALSKSRNGGVDAGATPRTQRGSDNHEEKENLGRALEDTAGEESLVDLLFDPILGCYYDPRSNKYYELK